MNLQTLPVTQKLSPNFAVGRDGHRINAVVIHKTEGDLDGALSWLTSPESKVSAHYVIAKTGKIYQLVDTNNVAWHCGVVVRPTAIVAELGDNPNLETIGIELEGFANDETPTEQVAALELLLAYIGLEYNLNYDENSLVFHREIDADKTCPGFNVDKQAIIGQAQRLHAALVGITTPLEAESPAQEASQADQSKTLTREPRRGSE